MKLHVSAACTLLLLALAAPAFGQTQYEMNLESKKAFEKADAALNDAYGKLLATLDDEGKKKLRDAERLWVKFRDAECDSKADDYRGGSIMPLIYFTCAKRLTDERTAQLKDRLGH